MRPIHVWRSRTPDGVRCALFPSVITTIMDQKVQLLKPLNKRDLNTTKQTNLKEDTFFPLFCLTNPALVSRLELPLL
jgi:hypothetical protein